MEWKASISPEEFEAWVAYYTAHPFDDRHRYHRPAALSAAWAARSPGKVLDLIEWLEPEPVPEGFSGADMNIFRAFGVRPPIRTN